jgi:hypothetical protein
MTTTLDMSPILATIGGAPIQGSLKVAYEVQPAQSVRTIGRDTGWRRLGPRTLPTSAGTETVVAGSHESPSADDDQE